MWFIRIQVNQHNYNSFKRITLSFVYFWQVIFVWAVMLHITKSTIKDISQTLSKSRQYFCKISWHSFVKTLDKTEKTLELEILVFSTAFSYSIGGSSKSIQQIRKLRETRTTRKNKITNQRRIYSSVKHSWRRVFVKIVNVF